MFSEQSVGSSHELVTQDTLAFIATGNGVGVIDWRNPGRPELIAEVDLGDDLTVDGPDEDSDPSLDVKDVKVDGDVAVLANDLEDPGGVAVYDISDPSDPQFESFYRPKPPAVPPANVHNCFVDGEFAYLCLAESERVDTDGDGEIDALQAFSETGVEIVDISDPANPTKVAFWQLKDEFPDDAKGATIPLHDCYVQDGLFYGAFWDAGTVMLDVSDPTDPSFISRFGRADDLEVRPPSSLPLSSYLLPLGNAHYVQPTPDGDHVFVGAETFPAAVGAAQVTTNYGGIRVFDVSDPANPTELTPRIEPPVVPEEPAGRLYTSHNFDVTANRLYTSWYNGGIHVYDITDPADPTRLAGYNPDDMVFWTAAHERGFILGGAYGALSAQGGMVVLHEDRGKRQPPAFESADPPDNPEVAPSEHS